MSLFRRRGTLVALTISTLFLGAACTGAPNGSKSESEREHEQAAKANVKAMPHEALEKYMMIAGVNPDEAGKESKDGQDPGRPVRRGPHRPRHRRPGRLRRPPTSS